ncbi:hypothetical protein EON79_16485 [bacterium]|nr:MAG: hypothetical protein EON79_16485 [bacterium]
MTFGWYGIRLELPDDFAPTSLSGGRRDGYVRLASGGAVGIQMRWRATKNPKGLDGRIETYLLDMKKRAKKARQEFDSDFHTVPFGMEYRYRGAQAGAGTLRFDPESERVVFLETVGPNAAMVDKARREIGSPVFAPKAGPETWAILGLRVNLPVGFELAGRKFLSGRTQLTLKKGRTTVVAERWGFAEQLVAKHSLQGWAAAALGFRNPEVAASEGRIAMEERRIVGTLRGLAVLDQDENQIRTVTARGGRLEPEWSWLDC